MIEVVGADGAFIAAFASPVEAYRYAALAYEGTVGPVFRRPDGGHMPFTPGLPIELVVEWASGDTTLSAVRA